jgi:Amidohydrolase family
VPYRKRSGDLLWGRRWVGALGVVVASFAGCAGVGPAPAVVPVVAYENGRVFDGAGFRGETLYVQGGHFVAPPERVDRVVDLGGGYVVAPFAEGHNHNLDGMGDGARTAARYLAAGVFYVANPNNLPRARTTLAGVVNRRAGLDVAFANGGLTGPGGHPGGIAERNIKRRRWSTSDGDGGFYFSVVDREALDRSWVKLAAARPDFVKVYLLYSDEYARRLSDPATLGWRGLDPALVPVIVARAHASRLRVAAHVETAADFHVAVRARVDVIAHMPGFRGDPDGGLAAPARFVIREEDAIHAAQNRITVVTTLAGLALDASGRGDAGLRQKIDELNRRNLATLVRAGVALAIGSDAYDDTSVGEALYLAGLGVLSPAALLRAWTETTARTIFPDRRIGRLAPGNEASFVVLADDPLRDFSAVTRVRGAVKQGEKLIAATAAPVPR